jgi:hypothetical protein
MSSVPPGAQLDLVLPPNQVVPTYYSNVLQVGVVGDEEFCLNFCIRSPEKPLLQANLQCRVITTVSNLRRIAQGLAALLAQYDQQKQAQAQAQARAQAPTDTQALVKEMMSAAPQTVKPGRSGGEGKGARTD